jgi:hypothetical protein
VVDESTNRLGCKRRAKSEHLILTNTTRSLALPSPSHYAYQLFHIMLHADHAHAHAPSSTLYPLPRTLTPFHCKPDCQSPTWTYLHDKGFLRRRFASADPTPLPFLIAHAHLCTMFPHTAQYGVHSSMIIKDPSHLQYPFTLTLLHSPLTHCIQQLKSTLQVTSCITEQDYKANSIRQTRVKGSWMSRR